MFWIIAGGIAFLAAVFFLTTYICYRMAFYSKPGTVVALPDGEIYAPFWDKIHHWAEQCRSMPSEDLWITSFDGLKLHGKYYEYAPNAPIEIMFHGYRGSAERDLAGGVQRCFALGHNALVVDQRCAGKSEGHVITFGINEHRDCLSWLDFTVQRFGPDAKIILTGISMGASTVLIAAGNPLPKNVVGILADCGFSTAKDIIKTVIRQMKLPADLLYPFVKWGAKIYGHFDLEETTALDAVSRCKAPVIFFHGEDDAFVPCHMSKTMHAACTCEKALIIVPGAGHGLSYPVAPNAYLDAMRKFFG